LFFLEFALKKNLLFAKMSLAVLPKDITDSILDFTHIRDIIGLNWTGKEMRKLTREYWYQGPLAQRLRAGVELRVPMPDGGWVEIRRNNGRLTDCALLGMIERENARVEDWYGTWTWICDKRKGGDGTFQSNSFYGLAPELKLSGSWLKVTTKPNSWINAMGEQTTDRTIVQLAGTQLTECNRALCKLTDNKKWGRQTFDAVVSTADEKERVDQNNLFAVDIMCISFDGKTLTIPNMKAFYHKVAVTQMDKQPDELKFHAPVIHAYCHDLCRIGYRVLYRPLIKVAIMQMLSLKRDNLRIRLATLQSPFMAMMLLQDGGVIGGDIEQDILDSSSKLAQVDTQQIEVASGPVMTNFATGVDDYIEWRDCKPRRRARRRFN
jgi:hypothetical protein